MKNDCRLLVSFPIVFFVEIVVEIFHAENIGSAE